MELVWYYYDSSMISVMAFVGIVLYLYGFVMVVAWYCSGTVLFWYSYGIGAVSEWCGYAMDIVLLYGIGMVFVW